MGAGTPIPENREVISAENVQNLPVLADIKVDTEEYGRLWKIAISPSNNYLAIGTRRGKIIVWDLKNLTFLYSLDAYDNPVEGIVFTDEASTLVSTAESIKIWDVKDSTLIDEIPSGAVSSLDISSDGKILIAGTDGWANPKKGAVLYSLENYHRLFSTGARRNGAWTRYVEFSNDGNWAVISATNDKFGIYNLEKREWTHDIALFGGGNNLNFRNGDLSPDNRFIAAQTVFAIGDPQFGGSWNDEIILWDVNKEEVITNFSFR